MRIIAIEGLDKSGKHTQSKMIVNYLRQQGYKVEQSEFHRYDTPTGQLIQKWLYKEYDVDQYTIELIMTADKQAQQKWFEELERQGVDFLILDRYIGSQKVYSCASGVDTFWTFALQQHLRKPDLEIYIDITPEESMKRKGKWGENDRYESDLILLSNVREFYLERVNTRSNRFMVNGMQSIEKIHYDIVGVVNEYIKNN